jgi:hypothetical protein
MSLSHFEQKMNSQRYWQKGKLPQDLFFFLLFIYKSRMASLKMGKTFPCLFFQAWPHITPYHTPWEEGLHFPLFPRVDFVLLK